jgi:hypothetical protein
MARKFDPHKLSSPRIFLVRMLVFLVLCGLICVILYRQILAAFASNPGLNGLIVGVLVIGILLSFRQVLRLFPEVAWVNGFRLADPGIAVQRPPALLASMAALLGDRLGRMAISTQMMRGILDSIATRLDEARDLSRYMTGLLIFLGLLGTFWGLIETVGSVGKVVETLKPGGDSASVFETLREGLAAPLGGMGIAFSSSLFGLAGSLVLGFLDLQANQAQNSFYNEMEEWLSGLTRLTGRDPTHLASEVNIPAYVQAMLEQTAENLENLQRAVARSEENQGTVHSGLIALTERLTALGDQIATEQALLARLIASQEELRPLLGRLVDSESGGFDEATRNHIRNMDVYLARILDETVQGRSQMTHELRSEIKMVARTIAAVAGDPRALSG